jgi:predicted aldo/keto reductase-like oxidoreductase
MQVLGGGAIPPKEALEYVADLPNIESILFGASSKTNIQSTVSIIENFDKTSDQEN